MKKAIVIFLMSVLVFTACGNGNSTDNNGSTPENTPMNTPVSTPELVETEPAELPAPTPTPEPAPAVHEQEPIRVFENGNANVRLFPDGTFIANLANFRRITGTYTELGESGEIVILFSYNGVLVRESGTVSTFETSDVLTQLFGEIIGDVLTIPAEWDEELLRLDYVYRDYPLVFANETGQKITLNADSSFTAEFINDVLIIGYHAMRERDVVFIPGSPSANSSGNVQGTFLDCRIRTRTLEDETEITVLAIPDLWAEVSGGGDFVLQ
jgi:hypothetical protein